MGSLNHANIPVVDKDSKTFRNVNGRSLFYTQSTNDGKEILVEAAPARELGPDNQKAWGLYREGRSTMERIASDVDDSRSLTVEKVGPEDSLQVIPDGQPESVQVSIRHAGNKIVESNSINHEVADRISND